MSRIIGIAIGLLTLNAVAAGAATLTVCASGCMYTDPQAAVNAARYGDTVLLRAGETFVSHLLLPAKSGTGWIDIRSDTADSLLPGPSVRLVPSDKPGGNTPRSRLARFIGRGGAYKTSALLRTAPGAHGYRIKFLDFDGVSHIGYETLVQLGDDGTAAPPYDIILDRVYVHGHATKGQKRGIATHGVRLSILNSYISDIKAVNADSQGIVGYNGKGPIVIENNHIEAAGENILFGGGYPATSGLVPSDIAIRRNRLYKPLTWRNEILSRPGSLRYGTAVTGSLASGTHYFKVVAVMTTGTTTAVSTPSAELAVTVSSGKAVPLSWSSVTGADYYRIYRGTTAGGQSKYLQTATKSTSFTYTGASELAGTPKATGTKWVVKNTLELKNAERVAIDGNVLENIWPAGQFGYAMVLTPREQGTSPWTRVRNVTITGNIVRGASGVINIAGYDDSGTTMRTERITLRNNLFYDIGIWGGLAKVYLIGGGPSEVIIDRNTLIHLNTSMLYPYGNATMPYFRYTNNISLHNKYGIMGESSSTGNPTIRAFFPGGVVTCNVLAGGSASLYPATNKFPTVTQWTASFQNYGADDYRVKIGSAVALAGCDGKVPGVDFAVLDATLGGAALPIEVDPDPAPEEPTTNAAPVARPGGPYTVAAGSGLSVSGSASTDSDGTIADYSWNWGDEVLVRAADLPATAIKGTEWVRESSSSAAGGVALRNPDRGAAKRTSAYATPASYVEFKVRVASGVPYRLWMRMNASGNSFENDSLYAQFSGAVSASGAAVARIGTTNGLPVYLQEGNGAAIAGWGWNDSEFGALAAPIYFATAGVQTIRIQAREDGIAWDQLVLSSATYYDAAPGLLRNDTIIVPRSLGTTGGVTASHRYEQDGIYPLELTVVDNDGAAGTAATTVKVGDGVTAGSAGVTATVARPGGPYTAAAGASLAVDGLTSTGGDGTIDKYRWTWGDEVLVRVAELDASALRGDDWVMEAASGAAGGKAFRNPNEGAAKRSTALASPVSYVEFEVDVASGVPYQLWMRMNAAGNAYSNDSLYVQFSNALTAEGTRLARIGTSDGVPVFLEEGSGAGLSGWGWNDSDYGALADPIYFGTAGPQTIRIQAREDGVAWDQFVLTSDAYSDRAPGALKDDSTVLPSTFGTTDGGSVRHTYMRSGLYPLALTVTDGNGESDTGSTTARISGGS